MAYNGLTEEKFGGIAAGEMAIAWCWASMVARGLLVVALCCRARCSCGTSPPGVRVV